MTGLFLLSVVLLDSTTASSLNWTTQPQESVEDGVSLYRLYLTHIQQGPQWHQSLNYD